MSKRGRSPGVDLRLNLSPGNSTSGGSTSENMTNSNNSSEMTVEGPSWEAEETRAMLLVGCPRCLMYVMLSEVDPKCPKCKSTVLLDFLNDDRNTITTKKTNN